MNLRVVSSKAERRILVHTLLVDVVSCWAGGFFHIKVVIFKVMMIFLDIIDLGNPRMTRKSHLTMNSMVL